MHYICLTTDLAKLGICPISRSNEHEQQHDNAKRKTAGKAILFDKTDNAPPPTTVPSRDAATTWPDTAVLIRLGQQLRLGLPRTLALILKNTLEKEQGRIPAAETTKIDAPEADEPNSEIVNFGPDCGAIHHAFIQADKSALAESIYDCFSFTVLIPEMIEAGLHLCANDALELQAFTAREEKACKLLGEEAAKQVSRFWQTRALRLRCYQELKDKVLELENIRLQNAHINQDWLANFGEAFHELEKCALHLENLHQRCRLLDENPGLSQTELDREMRQRERWMQNHLKELELKVAAAPRTETSATGAKMSKADMLRYQEETKALLMQLRMLLHPDKLLQNPVFTRLSEEQKQSLEGLWHRMMDVKHFELDFQPHQLGYHFRSLRVLHDMLAQAKAILGNPGVDTCVQLLIQGDTLAEQLDWLEQMITYLDQQLSSIHAEQIELFRDSAKKREQLDLESTHQQKFNDEMLALADAYRQESAALEATLASRIAAGGR